MRAKWSRMQTLSQSANLKQLSGWGERTSTKIRLNLLIQPYGCLEHTNFNVLVKIQWFCNPPAIFIILDSLNVTNPTIHNLELWNIEKIAITHQHSHAHASTKRVIMRYHSEHTKWTKSFLLF